ncbi:sensor domain-containing diguanylate cyclase [Paraburkholderia kururiensis]|uniref:diguanylate cyclase n=1 Tax=Paraburkholderia kururiensis TaxID=984307 RepID=A0ABZ0WJT0_9BURK|nr:sensor domain-containing diguanylate cyclase [Paraburkholderia kururiensis]WQD77598.1 sensor domain-containing diguanylate cyclase [Paraburkholderia kururiensis]
MFPNSVRRAAVLAGRRPFIVGALGTLLAAGVLGVSLLTLVAARDTAIQHAHETSRNVVAVLSSNISRTIESSDQSLQTLIAAVDKPAVQHMDADVRHELLFNRTAASRYVTGMGVTDARGRLIDGCCSSTHHWDFSDRDYFLVHRQSAKVGLYISAVYRARSRGGVEAMALSRRIDNADGSFKGVALVAIDVAYFRHLLDDLDVGPHGITAIVRTDGTLVARNPYLPPALTPNFSKSPSFPLMINHASGFYAARASTDGVFRLYTFQRVPGTPLIAVVAPALDDVLASWRTLAWMVGVSASAISFAFCAVVWLLAFALRDRALAEDRLTELTQTDSLTGLKNRRALDDVLENEWERLQRNDSSLSVLYVDADHFKQYNDKYGHAEGDKALKHLAACIARRVRRRGDCAARYGGEEFVVVLPDTDAANALLVAEGIREALEKSWRARRETATAGLHPFTVSIGCATARRTRPASLGELTKAADLALYEAKRAGRNCVRAASMDAPRTDAAQGN